MVITGSVAKWYFTRDKSQFSSSIFHTIMRLTVYHMGSVCWYTFISHFLKTALILLYLIFKVALGSLLITLVKIPRYILMWLQAKLKASGNTIAQYLNSALICCFWCLEKFLKFINSNAYTIISIEGVSFVSAAQKAFIIVVENSLRMATINR